MEGITSWRCGTPFYDVLYPRSVLGVFSPLLTDVFSYLPCCHKASLTFPDITSEVLSHLLNVLYTGGMKTIFRHLY